MKFSSQGRGMELAPFPEVVPLKRCEYLMGTPEREVRCDNDGTYCLTFTGTETRQRLCDFHAGRLYECMVPKPRIVES